MVSGLLRRSEACPRRRPTSRPSACGCTSIQTVGASPLAKAAYQPTWLWRVYISVAAGVATGGFALTVDSLWQTPQRKQRSRPKRPAPRLGSGFLRCGIPLGASPSGLLRCTCMRWVRLRRTALCASPQMNASAQPSDGAGGSRSRARSRAAGELTLGLLSGGGGSGSVILLLVGARPACRRRRPDSLLQWVRQY